MQCFWNLLNDLRCSTIHKDECSSHDTTPTVHDLGYRMFRMVSRSFLFPHVGLSVTFAEVNLGSRTFVAHWEIHFVFLTLAAGLHLLPHTGSWYLLFVFYFPDLTMFLSYTAAYLFKRLVVLSFFSLVVLLGLSCVCAVAQILLPFLPYTSRWSSGLFTV